MATSQPSRRPWRHAAAVHSPLVTSEHKAWAHCVLRVWDASEQLNINAECGKRPRRWIWEASQN